MHISVTAVATDSVATALRRVRSFFGGEVHFKLERTSCQQSLKYISLYNTDGAPFSTEKRNICLCN